MRNIPTQETATTELSADEFNDIPGELENAITSTGQTLTSSDLYQIAKAMAAYGAAGDFYTDSGTANAKVLTPIGNRRAPSAYSMGQRIRFKNAVLTTSDTVTARIGALSAIPFSDSLVSNGGTPLVSGDALELNEIVEAVYLTSPDGLTPFFFVHQRLSLGLLNRGSAIINNGDDYFLNLASNLIRLINADDGSYLMIKAGTGAAEQALEYSSGATGRIIRVGPSGVSVWDGSDGVSLNGGGIAFFHGALSAPSVTFAEFPLTDSAFNPTETTSGSNVWEDTGTTHVLTGLAFPKNIKGAWLQCRYVSSENRVCCPCHIIVSNSSGTCAVSVLTYLGNTDFFSATFKNHVLKIEFEN